MPLVPTRYYEHVGGNICCGRCWQEDLEKTHRGEYEGDEAVFLSDLELLPTGEAYQCDSCLEQSPEYENVGTDDG